MWKVGKNIKLTTILNILTRTIPLPEYMDKNLLIIANTKPESLLLVLIKIQF